MQTINIVILFSLVSTCLSSCGRSSIKTPPSSLKIVGGHTATAHSWPWIGKSHFNSSYTFAFFQLVFIVQIFLDYSTILVLHFVLEH